MTTLTPDEVTAIRVGDQVKHNGEWFLIDAVDFATSVLGWPIAYVHAHLEDAKYIGASVTISCHFSRDGVRFRTFKSRAA